MRQLLSLPAPTPRTAQTSADVEVKKERPRKFYDYDNPPPDDAPLEDLLEYWNRWADSNGKPVPSDVTKRRLLDVCTDDIKKLPTFISLFSYDESTPERIKELFDRASSDQLLDEYALAEVKKWLLFNSKFYLSELYARASKVKDDENGYVKNEEALSALARVDWQTAESLILTLAGGTQPRSSALAVTLLYRQAIATKDSDAEEKYRGRLKTIASDQTAPARARGTSIDALSLTNWSSRDDWYLSLFADDSLRELHETNVGFTPLMTLFNREPDKWIPVMTRLVESKDRAVQQAAASCLVNYATSNPRRDAILPALRWLSDPDWLDYNGTRRTWFMQKMADLDMPESVPGLIWIVENEPDNKPWAARTLAHYKDPRAVPVVKKALATQRGEDYRRLILQEFIPAGGISDSEAVAALEAYVTKRMTPEGRAEVDRYQSISDEPLPLPLSIAKYLADLSNVPGSLARSVLARAESLKKTNPAMAESLLAIATKWQSRDIDLDVIQRIASGTADAATIVTALERSANLRENLGADLQILLQRSDEAAGIGAVLLNDSLVAQTILTSGNQPAQIGLLASARLTQTSLPVELVGKLLSSKNALLAFAAERYLLVEDSKEARKLLWQHHPDQAFVTGWGEAVDYIGAESSAAMTKAEEKLRAELFKDDGPVEIFALFTGDDRYGRVLRIYPNKVVYTHYEDTARSLERVVSRAELATFKDFVTNTGLNDLGPQIQYCHHTCSFSEFVSLRKDEARRVFSYQGQSDWLQVATNFDLLGRGEGAKIHYELEKEIKGLEVLYADESLLLKDVWQRGDEIRIFVERAQTQEEFKQLYAGTDEDDDETARAEQRRKVIAQNRARFSWRKLTGDKAGAVVAQPEVYVSFDESKFPTDDGSLLTGNDARVAIVNADTIVVARGFDGLWKHVGGTKAVRLSESGGYANPIAAANGKWVVVAKADTDWSTPNYVVRFNLQTGREFRVKLAPAEDLMPVAFIAPHDRVLLLRDKDDTPEYYLLNPNTGETQLVTGEFAPLRQLENRFLQPTAQPNEYWAAIPDDAKDRTQVGRYNLKDFSFKPVLTIPQISFDSMAMWVDEARGKLYVVYKNQLLSLPLRPAAPTN